MKDKLILNNQMQIEIESASSLANMMVISETKYNIISVWDMFTPENLKSVQIQNGDGIVVANYENLVLDSETSTMQENGTILTSFHLREKTEVEFLRERVEQLENGQEVQDGAISDLGEAVSSLAEEGGLV